MALLAAFLKNKILNARCSIRSFPQAENIFIIDAKSM